MSSFIAKPHLSGVFVMLLLTCATPLQAKVRAVAKPTTQEAQQDVIEPVLQRLGPQAVPQYRRAVENPSERPQYTGTSNAANRTENYQNPTQHRLQFGPMPDMDEAQRWLQN